MKKSIFYLLAISVFFASSSCSKSGAQKVKLETSLDSVSYAIGIVVGNNNNETLKSALPGEDVNISAMAAAFATVSAKEDALISDEEASSIIQNFVDQSRKKVAQKNLEEGNKFLEENKSREGVVTTASGLQYEIITEGTGPKPTADDQVKVHYHGTLIDGTVFDSSVDRGEPVTFGVTQVIPGWTEALQLMPVGSKWKIFIPANLAYGERGAGADIGPNATIIFEVELLEIEK
jgi:FKBP-type peptidyl-prolyl cis-trans isomerase